jgi:PD-(D/E)XK nuclease superfamily
VAFLYINTRGVPHKKHSYSAGNDYDQCGLKYYLKRILGWREKEDKARFLFGHALEEAIQFHHDHDGRGAVEDFIQRWEAHKERTDLVYTKTEKDWETLFLDGIEMVKLYIIRQPELPIPLGGRSVFQREYRKEVFPGDPNYGDIEFEGRLDIIAYADPAHPLLVKRDWSVSDGIYRPVIIDIKTSGIDFPEQPGIAGLDKQLRVYSWLTGFRDVALLGFKKTGRSLKKGSGVTLLVSAGNYKAGSEAVVALVEDNSAWIVANDFMTEEMDRVGADQTRGGKKRRKDWLLQFGQMLDTKDLTRQRLQFISGYVSLESGNDAGIEAGRQIVQIVNSWKNKTWPNTFGIRYPHDDRNDPYFRAFVLGDEIYKQQHFIKTQEESFDDLLDDDKDEE